MRFFFEFVSCCGTACRSSSALTKPAEQRFVPLYAATVPVDSRRKSSRRFGSRSGSSSDWKPALNAISEDSVMVERENKDSVGGSDKITKKRKGTQSARKVQVRNYSHDDYRRAPFGGAMVPAFSPTPFFF